MPLSIEAQKSNYLIFLSEIKKNKTEGCTCFESYKKYSDSDGQDDYGLFELAFKYCDDEQLAEEAMDDYINEGLVSKPVIENLTSISSSKQEKTQIDIEVLASINIVVQILTKYAKTKYSKDHEEAIKEIAFLKSMDGISTGEGTKYYDLIPVFKKADRFGRWSLDPLFDHLKIYLIMSDESKSFPATWKIEKEQTLFKSIIIEDLYEESTVSVIKANKADKKQLRGFFSEILKYDNAETDKALHILKGLFIDKIKDLQSLTDQGWKLLFDRMPSKADEIREEIDKLDYANNVPNKKFDSKEYFEQMSDWHKLERFLFHEAKMFERLKKTGYLNLDALNANFDNERKVKSFNIDPKLLQDLQKQFSSFCLADEHKIKMNRGMLFYGPPGTGKTQLMKLVIRISGMTKYVEPLGSAELNRGLVGETEALLRDIFRRASYFPSIMFCIAIDEIDSLVPKRESKNENASKKDIVNQLLALIEGASDIKNIYLIGATNHLNKIDKAFARRMQDKFYIGFLNMNERLALIKSLNGEFINQSDSIQFTPQIDRLIEIFSINFSGAAASELKTKIKANYLLDKSKKFKIDKENLCQMANEIVKSHGIKFGGLSIPDLFSSITDKQLNEYLNYWQKYSSNFKRCTGRVNINLDEEIRSIQFELVDNNLLEISLSSSVAFIKNLIDSSFAKETAGDDENQSATANAIINFYDEFKEYTDGILVFNADEIVGINESGAIENVGFNKSKYNTSIIDQAVWTKAINSIFSVRPEMIDPYDDYPKKWHIFVTSSKFLNDSFKHLFKFPLTEVEKENKKIEEENANKEHLCVNCNRKYIEDDNRVDSCSYHPNMLISKLSTGNNYKGITKEQMLDIARSRISEEITKEYVYYCCLKPFDSDGCLKDKHSNSEIKINMDFDKKVKAFWKSNDSKVLFFKKSDHLWMNQQDKRFSFVEEKFDELILYDDSAKLYYKLSSLCIKTSKDKHLFNDKELISLGKWIY